MPPSESCGSGRGVSQSVELEAPPAELTPVLPETVIESGIASKVPEPVLTDALDALARLGTELERLSRSVVQRERELRVLIQLMQEVEREVFLEDVLDKIFDSFKGVIPFDRIGCAFLSRDGAEIGAYWAKSELGTMQIKKGYTQPLAGSSLEIVLRTGEPRIINDLQAYLDGKPSSDSTRRIVAEGGRSSLTCPLIVNGCPVGLLFFTSRYANAYRAIHQYVFKQIASQVALALARSRDYQELMDSNRALVERNGTLQVAATRDILTGALNRRAIDYALLQLLRTAPEDSRCGAVMVDLDHFKEINDTFGHPAGDLVLKEFVVRLSGAIRQRDALGRYGGEEFLILVPDCTREQLLATMERLRAAISDKPFEVGGRRHAVTASFGGAIAMPGTSPDDLIRRADQALYDSKARGRNCSGLSRD